MIAILDQNIRTGEFPLAKKCSFEQCDFFLRDELLSSLQRTLYFAFFDSDSIGEKQLGDGAYHVPTLSKELHELIAFLRSRIMELLVIKLGWAGARRFIVRFGKKVHH